MKNHHFVANLFRVLIALFFVVSLFPLPQLAVNAQSGGTTGAISGTVRNENGDLLADMNVWLMDGNDNLIVMHSTDATGTYLFSDLPEGEYILYSMDGCYLCEGGYVGQYYQNVHHFSLATRVTVLSNQTTENIDFVLEHWGFISGVVQDNNGDPIADANVIAGTNYYQHSGLTQADGSYRFLATPGEYRVSVQADNYADEFYSGTYNYRDAQLVTVNSGIETTGINFLLEPGGTISGTVLGPDQNPIPDSYVCAQDYDSTYEYDPDSYSKCVGVNNGSYILTGLPSLDYRIRAQTNTSGYNPVFYNNNVLLFNQAERLSISLGATRTGINFTLPPAGFLSGYVHDLGGNPIQNAWICSSPVNDNSTVRCGGTDSSGFYTISNLYEGSWYIYTWSQPWQNTFYPEPVLVSTGQNTPGIDLTLEPTDGTRHQFAVRANTDHVEAFFWTIGETLTLNIQPADPQRQDYSTSRTVTGYTPWDPTATYVDFNLGGEYDIQPGDQVSVSNGITTKLTIVSPLAFTDVNLQGNTVSGVSNPGSYVYIWAQDNSGNIMNRHIAADISTGTWTVDFSQPGTGGDEQTVFPLLQATWIDSQVYNNNLDRTMYGQNFELPPNPIIAVRANTDMIEAWEWPLGSTLTVKIYSSGIEVNSPDKTVSSPVGKNPWGDPRTYASFNLSGVYDIQPGNLVTMTDGITTKKHVVTSLAFDVIDTTADTISGIALPGSRVDVWACDNANCYNRHVITDIQGKWLADWSIEGPEDDEKNTYDLIGWNWVDSSQPDDDGDLTYYGQSIPNPWIEASATGNWVQAREWPINTDLTLTINGAGGDYSTTARMGQAPWNPNDPNDILAMFDMQGYDIQVGDTLAVTDGNTEKVMHVSRVNTTFVDAGADIILGIADPGSHLHIWVCDSNHCANRSTYADGDGNWTANFSVIELNGDGTTFDLVPGTNGGVQQYDSDSDITQADWRVPNPNFSVRAQNGDQVEAYEWPMGTTLILEIDDPETGPGVDYSTSQVVVDLTPWDPNQTYTNFDLYGIYDIQPGFVVSLTDGTTVKTHTVTSLMFTEINIGSDIVSGNASPNARVDVWACNASGNCVNRNLFANGSGVWSANFALPDDNGNPTFDLDTSTWIDSQEWDDQNDRTIFGMGLPLPLPPNDFNTFIMATNEDVITLDPALAYDIRSSEVLQNVYETLVFFNGDKVDDYVPKLADSYYLSEDELTWTFHIRQGTTFHNGDPLTAADVAYSFQRGLLQGGKDSPQWLLTEAFLGVGINDISSLLDPGGGLLNDRQALQDWNSTQLVAACEQVKAAIMADDLGGTVSMHLKQPWASFLATIAGSWGSILDKGWTIANGGWDGTCNTWQNWYAMTPEEDPLTSIANGTGPFKLYDWTPSQGSVLLRNTNYWSAPAQLESVVIRNIPDDFYRLNALLTGAADQASFNFPPAQADEMVGEDCVWNLTTAQYECSIVDSAKPLRRYIGQPSTAQDELLFNFNIATDSNPYIGSGQLDGNGIPPDFFADINIRKAFSYSFDWNTYNQELFDGSAVQQKTLALPGMPGYDPNAPYYPFDLAQSEAQFKLADLDHDGIAAGNETDGTDVWNVGFHLHIYYNVESNFRKVMAGILAANVSAINTKFVVEAVGIVWPDYLAAMSAFQLPTMASGWVEDIHDPHNWYQPFTVGLLGIRQNLPTDLVAQFQPLVDQGAAQVDYDARDTIYKELNKAIYDNATFIMMGVRTKHFFVQRNVNGILHNPVFAANYYYPIYKGAPVPPAVFIMGRINDVDGNPLTGVSVPVRVLLKSNGSEVASTMSDPTDGSYHLTGLLAYNQELVVVASDEDPDTDGFAGRYYNNVDNLTMAESIVLTGVSPARAGVNINLSEIVETPIGADVSIDPAPWLTINFEQVDLQGFTSVAETYSDPADLPGGFQLIDTVYDIESSAVFTQPAQVCFNYDDTGLTQEQESQLQLLHQENLEWVNRTDAGYPDTITNTICGTVNTFSPFAILYSTKPVLQLINAPLDPQEITTVINASAAFLDLDLIDTHAAVWDWGDGRTSKGLVDESIQEVTGSHVYSQAGVYTVTLTLTDAAGDFSSLSYQYVVIYDPDAGFVTGGGWINSPAGAYTTDPLLTGKATFGFVSKYQKGANVPTGNTEFQFKVADLNFSSTVYDWMVIAGAKAQYKGTGTINGTDTYRFMLTANDGQISGGGEVDKFRIKIWDPNTGQVVYDNQHGAADDALPATAIQGGSIVIHK